MSRRTWWLCAALMLGGCAPGNTGLIIAGVVAPGSYPTCTYDSANSQYLDGVIDIASETVQYTMVPLFYNQLINLSNSGSSGPASADPNVMQVQSAQVELQDVTGATLSLPGLPNPFTVPATGFVPSSDGMTAGQGVGRIQNHPSGLRRGPQDDRGRHGHRRGRQGGGRDGGQRGGGEPPVRLDGARLQRLPRRVRRGHERPGLRALLHARPGPTPEAAGRLPGGGGSPVHDLRSLSARSRRGGTRERADGAQPSLAPSRFRALPPRGRRRSG